MNLIPDNAKLLALIKNHCKVDTDDSYRMVVKEIEHGNAFFVISTKPDVAQPDIPLEHNLEFDVGLHFVQGLKVLAVFTSEELLYAWAKEERYSIRIDTIAILKMCDAFGIDAIVIDSNSPTMFIMEKKRELSSMHVDPKTGLS